MPEISSTENTFKHILLSCFCVKQYPHTPGFVGFAVRLVEWSPLFLLTPGCVGISQVVQLKKKQTKKTKQRECGNKKQKTQIKSYKR